MKTALVIIGVLLSLGWLAMLAVAGVHTYRQMWREARRTAKREPRRQ